MKLLKSISTVKLSEAAVWLVLAGLALVAIALSEVAPALTPVWRIACWVGVLALFAWQKQPWLRDDAAEDSLFRPLPREALRLAWIVLGIAVAFQVIHWLADSGGIRARTGEDDEGYVFLAYRILGYYSPQPPLFLLREPGWPGLIALLLSIFGHQNIWVVGVFNRLLLALAPVAYYSVFARVLRPIPAVAGALFTLALPYNEVLAATAMREVVYSVLLPLALGLVAAALSRPRPVPWLLLAGLLLATRCLIRFSASAGLLGLVIAVLLIESQRPLVQRLLRGAALALPGGVAVAGLLLYNWITYGTPSPFLATGPYTVFQFGHFFDNYPQTPAIQEYHALLPELDESQIFFATPVYVAEYRYVTQGHGTPQDYYALMAEVARDLRSANRDTHLQWILIRGNAITLLHPRHDILPPEWRLWPYQLGDIRTGDYTGDMPNCLVLDALDDPRLADAWCPEHARLRAQMRFQPPIMANLPRWLSFPASVLTVSLPYRVRWLAWPLYMGLAGYAALVALLLRTSTRPLAWLIGLPLLGEYLPMMLASTGIHTTYLMTYQSLYVYATWIVLGLLVTRLVRARSDVGTG